jgi:hypothetical protein
MLHGLWCQVVHLQLYVAGELRTERVAHIPPFSSLPAIPMLHACESISHSMILAGVNITLLHGQLADLMGAHQGWRAADSSRVTH